jgi:hypothetical protein
MSLEKLLQTCSSSFHYWVGRFKEVARFACDSGMPPSSGGYHAQALDVVRAVALELERMGLPVYRRDPQWKRVSLLRATEEASEEGPRSLTLFQLLQLEAYDEPIDEGKDKTSVVAASRVATSVYEVTHVFLNFT